MTLYDASQAYVHYQVATPAAEYRESRSDALYEALLAALANATAGRGEPYGWVLIGPRNCFGRLTGGRYIYDSKQEAESSRRGAMEQGFVIPLYRKRVDEHVLDAPEDRLWHAKDRTWWRRAEDGRLVAADAPKEDKP